MQEILRWDENRTRRHTYWLVSQINRIQSALHKIYKNNNSIEDRVLVKMTKKLLKCRRNILNNDPVDEIWSEIAIICLLPHDLLFNNNLL